MVDPIVSPSQTGQSQLCRLKQRWIVATVKNHKNEVDIIIIGVLELMPGISGLYIADMQ